MLQAENNSITSALNEIMVKLLLLDGKLLKSLARPALYNLGHPLIRDVLFCFL